MIKRNNSSIIENRSYNGAFPINRNKEKKQMIMDFYSKKNFQNKVNDIDLYHFYDCLKEIITEKLSLNTFINWFTSLVDILELKNKNIHEYLNNIYFLKNDENLSTEFFKYCYKFYNSTKYYNNPDYSKYCQITENIYNTNILGTLCFISPDIGYYDKDNKIGKIIEELSKGLNKFGLEIIIVSLYYHENKLKSFGLNKLRKIKQISIQLDTNYTFDIYFEEKNGIKYYLIYHPYLFERLHPNLTGAETIREISCFSKASLDLLLNLNIIPEIIITNDPYTGFTPAYARIDSFYNIFNNTKFIHLCNNINNQGRIFLPLKEGTYEHIHQLPNDIVTDIYDCRIINPLGCALRMSDRWATLSKSYITYLLKNAKNINIFPFLNEKKNPIYISSGITKEQKFEIIMNGGDKEDAKRIIQKKYFCYKVYNPNIPLYSFIGNLSEENGALLLLDIAEKLFKETNNKINILIIGNGDINDPYYQVCLKKINYLKMNYPFCIYAEPNRKFSDEEIFSFMKGSDFGLIPFLYDNWINLHFKYFVAGAPIIGFGVGHLKDAVKEFNFNYMTGNGFLFDHFNSTEFYLAIRRSLDLFNNEIMFEKCKINCEESIVEFDEICLDLCKELCKINNKIFFKYKDIYNYNNIYKDKCYNSNIKFQTFYNTSKTKKKKCSEDIYDSNHFSPDYNEFGKNVKKVSSCKTYLRSKSQNRCIKNNNNNLYTISYKIDFPQPKKIQITGSYDNWSTLKNLKYNNKTKKWEIVLNLKKGKYYYKFLIDGKYWKINPFEHYHKEYNGLVNNILYIV